MGAGFMLRDQKIALFATHLYVGLRVRRGTEFEKNSDVIDCDFTNSIWMSNLNSTSDTSSAVNGNADKVSQKYLTQSLSQS